MSEFPIDCFTEFTAAANREDLNVRGKSTECLIEHCQSATPDFWMLTYTFRPTRKTLFIYVRISIVVVCTISPMYMGLTKREMARYWPRSFLACLWTSTAEQKFLIWKKNNAFFQDTMGNPKRASWSYLARSGSQSQHRLTFFVHLAPSRS